LAQLPPGTACYRGTPQIIRDWHAIHVDGADIVEVERKGNWHTIDAYACGYLECSQIVPPEPWKWTEETELRVCVSVGATYTVEAKVGFKLALLGTLGIRAQTSWDLEGQVCFTKRQREERSFARFQCYPTTWRGTWTHRTLDGYMEEAREKVIFQIKMAGCTGEWQTAITYCGYRQTQGNADDTSGLHIQQPPFFDPNEEIPGDDQYDGVRIHPCCEPLYPSDPLADPCCGCWGVP